MLTSNGWMKRHAACHLATAGATTLIRYARAHARTHACTHGCQLDIKPAHELKVPVGLLLMTVVDTHTADASKLRRLKPIWCDTRR